MNKVIAYCRGETRPVIVSPIADRFSVQDHHGAVPAESPDFVAHVSLQGLQAAPEEETATLLDEPDGRRSPVTPHQDGRQVAGQNKEEHPGRAQGQQHGAVGRPSEPPRQPARL